MKTMTQIVPRITLVIFAFVSAFTMTLKNVVQAGGMGGSCSDLSLAPEEYPHYLDNDKHAQICSEKSDTCPVINVCVFDRIYPSRVGPHGESREGSAQLHCKCVLYGPPLPPGYKSGQGF